MTSSSDSAPEQQPSKLTLVVATRNPDKLAELREILGGRGIEILSYEDLGDWPEPEESGNTIEENALIKARAVFERFGIPAIADDTALEVDELKGAPGVRSARYAGEGASYEDNRRKLLSELEGVPPERRGARFRTAAVAIGIGSTPIVVVGELRGKILTEERGSHGFGYDPVFVPEGHELTFAEMPASEKNAISHRARAFKALAEAIESRLMGLQERQQ
jgi:XTP/dITP diphosphohydrolase